MKRDSIEEPTYVLFGSEAVKIYGLSINMLLSCVQLEYKIAAFNEVSKFVIESKKWDGFLEINENDYMLLKNHLSKAFFDKKRKIKPLFLNFLK